MSVSTTSHSSSLSHVTRLCVDDPEVEKANLAIIFDRYKGSITSLPKEKGWLTESLYMYQGYWFPSKNLISIGTVMASQDVFQANPTDIYLVTPPKSGTTWIKALAFAIVNRKRNPKDVLVSMFHFVNKLRDKSLDRITIEEAFKMFCKGITPCGPYWDHVKGYYKASLEQPTLILFLTYENMKLDTANNVKRLADFLGYPFTMEEEAKGVVQDIVSLCSFKSLSDANKNGNIREGLPKESFFREGKVGDWSNHLTKEMSQILDEITKEKFNGLNIMF